MNTTIYKSRRKNITAYESFMKSDLLNDCLIKSNLMNDKPLRGGGEKCALKILPYTTT